MRRPPAKRLQLFDIRDITSWRIQIEHACANLIGALESVAKVRILETEMAVAELLLDRQAKVDAERAEAVRCHSEVSGHEHKGARRPEY